MKRLANLIMTLDMNVVITAHAKTEYGQNFAKIGYTFDGWRQLDYWFDLVVELGKKGKKRTARVVKTRIDTFPDEDVFEWSYDAICQPLRCENAREGSRGGPALNSTPGERSQGIALGRPSSGGDGRKVVRQSRRRRLGRHARQRHRAKCIEYVKNRLPQPNAAA